MATATIVQDVIDGVKDLVAFIIDDDIETFMGDPARLSAQHLADLWRTAKDQIVTAQEHQLGDGSGCRCRDFGIDADLVGSRRCADGRGGRPGSVLMITPMYDTQMPGAIIFTAGASVRIAELPSMPPRGGSQPCIVRTDFGFDVSGPTTGFATINAKFGVSNPSEAEYPMRPFIGYAHPEAKVVVRAGQRQHVQLARWDIINPKILATATAWSLVKASNGNYPHLTGEVSRDANGGDVRIENICFVCTVTLL